MIIDRHAHNLARIGIDAGGPRSCGARVARVIGNARGRKLQRAVVEAGGERRSSVERKAQKAK